MIRIITVAVGTIFLLQMQSTLVGGGNYLPIFLSIVLVAVGPLFSILLTYPRSAIIGLLDEFSAESGKKPGREENLAERIRELAKIWNAVSPRDFDQSTVRITNPFLRKGMEMVADGYSPEEIRRILEKNYERYLSGRESRLNILNSLIRLTQSFGFMGTVIGLIVVLGNLQDSANIGVGVSVALFTTLYGLLFANFIYIPLHRQYADKIRHELQAFPVITEGVVGLANRESASHIYYKLNSCLAGELPMEPAARPLRLALAGSLFPGSSRK